jgi:hypothetical protein
LSALILTAFLLSSNVCVQKVDTVRIAREGQLQGAIETITFTMTVDQSLYCPLDLNAPCALHKGVR